MVEATGPTFLFGTVANQAPRVVGAVGASDSARVSFTRDARPMDDPGSARGSEDTRSTPTTFGVVDGTYAAERDCDGPEHGHGFINHHWSFTVPPNPTADPQSELPASAGFERTSLQYKHVGTAQR